MGVQQIANRHISRTFKATGPAEGAKADSRRSPGRTAVLAALLAAVAFIAYANAWPNALVLDDTSFLEFHRHADLSDLGRHFAENAWAVRGLESELYRPLLLVGITVDAILFGDWYAGYHLVNILWHAAVTVLVFGFIACLLRREPGTPASHLFVAFCVALLFAVHPAHTEAVNSVFNRSSVMAAFGVIGGLWWLLAWFERRPAVAWAGALLAYTFALFCRESAIVMPAMAAVLAYLYSEGSLRRRLLRVAPVLSLLAPMSLFLQLRGLALADPAAEGLEAGAAALAESVAAGRIFHPERVLDIAGQWASAVRLLLWPFDLRVVYDLTPRYLDVLGLFLHAGLIAWGLLAYRRGFRLVLAGLAIFYLALLPSSLPLALGVEQSIQLRFLYLASVGFFVIIAGLLQGLHKRFDRVLTAAPVVLLVLVFIPVTWARNELWADNIELFESDYRKGSPNDFLLRLITAAYAEEGNYARVLEICDANSGMYAEAGVFAAHCAAVLDAANRTAEAEAAYRLATGHKSSRGVAYSNMARFYLRHGRRDDARLAFEQGIEAESDPAIRAYRTGYMLLHLYPASVEKRREAAAHFEEALRLRPDLGPARTWLDRVNEALGVDPEAE